jgi:small subunit ribosomal protein S9
MKVIHFSGKRKRAIARATLKDGKGVVRVNKELLDVYKPEMCKMKIMEPLLLSGETAKKVNISVRVEGGGQVSQADAVRLAIGRCLVKLNPNLKKTFLDYDRTLLVADVRRNEPHKPNDSKPRAKRQKSYR